MIRSLPFGSIRLVLFLVGYCLPAVSLLSVAQAELNLTGSSNCTAADFDTRLQFSNEPGDYYAIVVNKRNVSNHPCVFDGPMYGPSFYPDRNVGEKPFALCYDCENRLPDGQYPIIPPLTLGPRQVAFQTFRWKTKPAVATVLCLQPKWMSGPVMVVAPSLLKQICSDVEVSRFRVVKPPGTDPKEARPDSGQSLVFQLTSAKRRYYAGETFSLHLSVSPSASEMPPTRENCPTLYLRQRSPDGATRIDEVQPISFKRCGQPALGHPPGDWQSGFEIDSGANSRWEGFGEHTMEVFQLPDSPAGDRLHFVTSNVQQIEVADPSRIPRKWGTRVKGVAVDVTLDKDTFLVGEDVPLHLAVEDFDAQGSIYSWDPLWDPCEVVGIEVQDSHGHPLHDNERFPLWSVCTSHGFGPRPFAKGKVIALERTLGRVGWLPNHSGTYTVVITWAPCIGPKNEAANAGLSPKLKPYAIARATTTIHLIGGDTALK